MRKLVTGCYAAMLVLSAALPAVASQAAPPRYQSSDPSDGATVHEPPDRVEVTFDQPLDESSRLLVKDDCGKRVDNDSTEVDGNTMSTVLSKKPSGDYHVEYVAVGLGGVTGRGEGHFTFTAHGGDPCDGSNNNHQHNNKNNGHNNNQHENRNHENGNHQKGKHENREHGSGDDHTTHIGTGAGSTHSDHDAAGGNMSGHQDEHGTKHDEHAGGNHDDPSVALGDPPGITSSDTSRKLLSRADSGTLLLSLALCLVLGVLGGAILRTSGAR